MSLTIGWEDNTEEWWWGVIWILFSVGVLKIVPAASNRGVCFGAVAVVQEGVVVVVEAAGEDE